MNVYFIRFRGLDLQGRNRFILFETDVPSMKALTERMNAGHLVHGYKLRTKPVVGDHGSREVIDVTEESISLEDVLFIGQPRWKLVRFEDDAA